MKKLLSTTLLLYVKFFAKIALRLNKPTIIGITGSAGKTSTRNAIFSVLKDHKKTYMIEKGNSESGVPLGILGLHVDSIGFSSIHRSLHDWSRILIQSPRNIFFLKKYAYLIIEMGVDDPQPPRNMGYLLSIVKPHIAVVLNAFPAHAEQFERVITPPITDEKISAAIAHEKCKIITANSQCRYAIFNADNVATYHELKDSVVPHATFGSSHENTLQHSSYTVSLEKTKFGYMMKNKKIVITLKNVVLPNVLKEAFAAALLVGDYLGIQTDQMISSLENNYTIEPGRNTVLDGIENTTLIDSSYNGPSDGMKAMLALAIQLKQSTKRPLAFVMGDMRELGSQSKEQHESLIPDIQKHVDYLYTVGPLTHMFIFNKLKKSGHMKNIFSFEGPHEAGQFLKKNIPYNAIVLFKGSQNTIFLEETIKYVLKDIKDAERLPRQEKYWLQNKQFMLGNNSHSVSVTSA